MDQALLRVARRYETSLDRAGIALGVGSALAGGIVVALLIAGGQRDPLALLGGWMIGALFSAIAITAVGGPLWLVLHVAGLRRARYAALAGALTAMVIFVGGQTYGFGLFDAPPMAPGVWRYRWISALLSSGVLAAIAAMIAAIMWRIAYRRSGDPQDSAADRTYIA